jgi:hypothetical protein
MDRDQSKCKTQGYDLYRAYLPLGAVRAVATSEGFGFHIKASLSSSSGNAEKAALPLQ